MYRIVIILLLPFTSFTQHIGYIQKFVHPTFEDKSNTNGSLYQDSKGNTYGLYYNGLITLYKNNREIVIPKLLITGNTIGIEKIGTNRYIGFSWDKSFIIDGDSTIELSRNIKEKQFLVLGVTLDSFTYYTFIKNNMSYAACQKGSISYLLDSNITAISPNTHLPIIASKISLNKISNNSLIEIAYSGKTKLVEKVIANLSKHTSDNKTYGAYYSDSNIVVHFKDYHNVFDRAGHILTTNKLLFGVVLKDRIINSDKGIHTLHFGNFSKIGGIELTSKPNYPLSFNKYTSTNIGTENHVAHYFHYMKYFPNIFSNGNSSDLVTLTQLKNSKILAGSYAGYLISIDVEKKHQLSKNFKISNGGLSIGNTALFEIEGIYNHGLLIVEGNKCTPIYDSAYTVGFYLFKSTQNIVYNGTAGQGLCYLPIQTLVNNNRIKWNKVGLERLGDFHNIITITEDKLGRIWFGHPKKGIGIYKPDIDSVQLFLMSQNKTNIGAFSSLTDYKGTVWIGTGRDGLYAVDGNKKSISLNDFTKIQHSFFMHGEQISALSIHGNHLIINVTNKTLILDLNQYYKGVINIKYLSEKESNYETSTEQNTLLVAKDSTIWFSTSDMLYQWDFKQWLSIPKDKIKIYTTLEFAKQKDTISTSKKCTLKPTNNSFTVDIDYYHPDLLPRYFVFGLQYEKDTFSFSKPQTNSTLSYTNLQSGNYTFHVKVLELDGSTSYYQYKIYIDTFWWQKWWVISLIGLIIFGSSFLYYRNYQTRKTIEIVAKNKALEIEQLKANTNLELSKLNVQSLANQIRPHFLLNTLNAIGASIQEEKGENLLDNLANSVNLLFNQSISGKQVHSLTQEIQICNNIIAIYKSMYLPKLILEQSIESIDNKGIDVPFGLMQIPIENALQHGLRNKIDGECKLKIRATIEYDYYVISIVDNGIGRKASAAASNARKHGTGLKNIMEIISIFNTFNCYKIEFDISDNDKETGTMVTIKIPKKYNYDINT